MELKTSAEVERPLRLPLPRPYPRLLPLPLPRSLSLLGKLQLAAGMTTSAEEHLAKPKRLRSGDSSNPERVKSP